MVSKIRSAGTDRPGGFLLWIVGLHNVIQTEVKRAVYLNRLLSVKKVR